MFDVAIPITNPSKEAARAIMFLLFTVILQTPQFCATIRTTCQCGIASLGIEKYQSTQVPMKQFPIGLLGTMLSTLLCF